LETQQITESYQMQSHMAILIAYCIGMKKTIKHCWILQFLLENGKKRTFSYKVALKNSHGRAKGGGHRTVALPLNTPLCMCFVARVCMYQYHSTRRCLCSFLLQSWIFCIHNWRSNLMFDTASERGNCYCTSLQRDQKRRTGKSRYWKHSTCPRRVKHCSTVFNRTK